MIERLLYAFCGLGLLTVVGYRLYESQTFSGYDIIQASSEYRQGLDGKGVVVAVIDEGFDPSHGDLKFSAARYNTDNRSDDVSESIVYKDGSYQFESHGTHVTGIILAISPKATIIPIKLGVFGGDQAFVKAMDIAAKSSANVVNISMYLSHTGRKISPNVHAALLRLAGAGKLIVIAAGNEGKSLMSSAYTASLVELSHDPQMQGRIILAGATSYKGGREDLAEFSNYPGKSAYGCAQTYFLSAPGDQITSTITGGRFGEKSGTSMAAPMIVGIASLVKQAMPELTMDEVASLMLKSARKVSLGGQALSGKKFGAGIVNLKSTLEFAAKMPRR